MIRLWKEFSRCFHLLLDNAPKYLYLIFKFRNSSLRNLLGQISPHKRSNLNFLVKQAFVGLWIIFPTPLGKCKSDKWVGRYAQNTEMFYSKYLRFFQQFKFEFSFTSPINSNKYIFIVFLLIEDNISNKFLNISQISIYHMTSWKIQQLHIKRTKNIK